MLAGPTGWVLISSVSSESSVEISKDSGVVVLSSKNEEGSDEAIVSLDHSEDDDDDDEFELWTFSLMSYPKLWNYCLSRCGEMTWMWERPNHRAGG